MGLKVSFDFIHIIAWVFALSVFLKLIVEIIVAVRKGIFPDYLNFFIAFSGLIFIAFNDKDAGFIVMLKSSFLLFVWLLTDYLISRKTDNKLENVDYELISGRNLLFFSFTLGIIVLYLLFTQISGKGFSLNTIVLILLSVNPSLNRIIVNLLKSKQNLPKNALVLPKVRTFIFSSDKIISKNTYKLINFKNHSQISKDKLIQISYELAKEWSKSIAAALKNEIRSISFEKSFQMIKESPQGIYVKDIQGDEFIFGEYSLVKNFIRFNDATHYLLKNNVLLAKFTFRELFNVEGIRLSNQFNEYGNVVLISDKPESTAYNKLPFDKIYFNLTKSKQKELIKNLTQKAPTALITTDKNLCKIASFDFLTDENKKLSSVYEKFSLVKSIFKRLNNTLILFFTIEMVIAAVALFFSNRIIYVLLVNLSISLLYILLLKKQKKLKVS
ncbi:MAG: hypothetical protein L3J74_09005 [Bacteroidales bacterium]|nr:hypothetical protein [Bacteroidales bacterium]